MPREFQLDFDGFSGPLRLGKVAGEGLFHEMNEFSEKGLEVIHVSSVQMND